MKEIKLAISNSDEVRALFCECFADNHFYQKQFDTVFSSVLKERMAREFKDVIAFACDSGMSYGLADQYNNLRAFLLAFDYSNCLKNSSDMFYSIFSGIPEEGTEGLPYYKGFHEHLLAADDVVYLMSCGVDEIMRNCGYATQLVKRLLLDYPGRNVAADVTSRYMVKIFKNLNYKCEEIEDDYWVCRNF